MSLINTLTLEQNIKFLKQEIEKLSTQSDLNQKMIRENTVCLGLIDVKCDQNEKKKELDSNVIDQIITVCNQSKNKRHIAYLLHKVRIPDYIYINEKLTKVIKICENDSPIMSIIDMKKIMRRLEKVKAHYDNYDNNILARRERDFNNLVDQSKKIKTTNISFNDAFRKRNNSKKLKLVIDVASDYHRLHNNGITHFSCSFHNEDLLKNIMFSGSEECTDFRAHLKIHNKGGLPYNHEFMRFDTCSQNHDIVKFGEFLAKVKFDKTPGIEDEISSIVKDCDEQDNDTVIRSRFTIKRIKIDSIIERLQKIKTKADRFDNIEKDITDRIIGKDGHVLIYKLETTNAKGRVDFYCLDKEKNSISVKLIYYDTPEELEFIKKLIKL